MSRYTLYFDSQHEAEWLAEHSDLLRSARLARIGPRGTNPKAIDNLILYDRPDVVITDGSEPILTVEKTKEVPTGHNVGQRMARLVRSIECGVPVIYKAPFDARKHGIYTGPCFLNIRLLEAFRRITEIHGVPIVAVNTPVDENHEIIEDGATDETIEAILDAYLLDRGFEAFAPAQRIMSEEYRKRLARRAAYGKPPSTVTTIATSALLGWLPYKVRERDRLLQRKESVVYSIGMTPAKCRREDPYTGTAFIYDYTLCRSGPSPADKKRNLILSIPQVSLKRWLVANPNDISRKSSNWYATATMIALSDGYLFVDDGRLLGTAFV
jgi:hypothetical protein